MNHWHFPQETRHRGWLDNQYITIKRNKLHQLATKKEETDVVHPNESLFN